MYTQHSMNLIFVTVFILVLYLPSNEAAKGAYLVPDSTVLTRIGSSYTLMLKHDSVDPIECYIFNGVQKYSIELFQPGISASPVPNDTYSIEPKAETDIITSLGNGVCGFQMDAVSQNTPQKWNVSFLDQARNVYYGERSVVIRAILTHKVVIYQQVGKDFSVHCVPDDAYRHDLLYAEIYGPQGQLIKSDVSEIWHTIQNTTLSDFGTWKCLKYYNSDMLPIEEVIEVIPIAVDIVETWNNVTDHKVHIGCSVTNASTTGQVQYCVMVRPDGKQIALMPGLATARYTALGTNLTKDVCAMEISLPLEDSEKGLWKCEQHAGGYSGPIGGFINVSAESSPYTPEPSIPEQVFAHINSTLSMKCRVPFSSSYCYMRGPDGFMYPLNNVRKNSLGECEFVKTEAQITDNGTWVCGFGKQTGEPDAVYTFQVFIPEPIPIQPEIQEIETRTAGTARLVCTTKGLGNYPLSYCRFLSPDGKMYQIENHQTSDRMSYEGRGLEYGDCGITLQDINESDQGTWSCITRLQKEKASEEVYTNIHLSINDKLSLASTLGIAFGVIGVVVVGAVFFIHRFQKRRNYQTSFDADVPDAPANLDSATESQNHDIIFDVRQDNTATRRYNATDATVSYGSGNISNPFDGNGSDSSENNSVVFDMMDETTQARS